MEVRSLLEQQLQGAYQILAGTMADCTDDVMHKRLEGATINSIAAIYAHATFDEDLIVNGMVRGQQPVFRVQGWGEKLGMEFPSSPMMSDEWASGIRIDLPKFQEYADAVHAATLEYVKTASDDDLEQKVKGPFGETTKAGMVGTIALYHLSGHTGEIAALKGAHGLKGLPF